jgi:hyperosmotically inducible protein
MIRRRPFHRFATAAALALLGATTLLTAGCGAGRSPQTLLAPANDDAIVAAVKAGFADSPAVDAGAVSVQSQNGEVTLTGLVRSATEKTQAEQIARRSPGVRAVRNSLGIRP